LRRDYQQFLEADIEVAVIGPENAKSFQDYWTKHNLPFIGLPDPEHVFLRLYGQQVKLFKLGRLPAQMFVDKTGMLRFVYYGHSMSDIPSNEELLKLVTRLKEAE
jgi:peroxiredoxin Q/BCP